MFAPRYFGEHYFAPRYFPPVLDIVLIEIDRNTGGWSVSTNKIFRHDQDMVDIIEIIIISGMLDD